MKVQNLLHEAQAAQRQLQEELAASEAEARTEGGPLRVRLNGLKELVRVRFPGAITYHAGGQLVAKALMVVWQKAREAGARAGQLLAGLSLPGELV